ncbi:MAG: hypothetical protein AABZ47_00885 [Planctomycetota bacterium]
MLRKWIMVILVLSGLITAIASGLSFARPLNGRMQLTDRAVVHVFVLEGLLRILLYTADKPIVSDVQSNVIRVKTPQGETCTNSRIAYLSDLRAARTRMRSIPFFAWRRAIASRASGGMVVHHSFVRLPGWVVTALFLLYPAAGAIQNYRKRRQLRLGACSCCGYDLTGNESGRCPECGQPT